jgi:signal transduction histidine kinase
MFKLKLLLALFHSAILTAIMGISELAVFGILSRFFPHFLLVEGVGFVFYAVFSKSFFFAVIYMLIYIFRGKTETAQQHDKSELLLMLIPISSIFIMFTFLAIGETSSFAPPIDFMVTICAVFLLMVNLLVFGINQYIQKKSHEFTNMQLQLQKESDSVQYYEMVLSQNENQSILIHDIKKHLQSIKLLNEKGEASKINSYINQLMEASDLKETAKICDNDMLNAILCRYQRQCNDKHINFNTDIRSGSVNNIYHHDLTSLFCNLLDNAVESAENIPDSFIELTVQRKEISPFIIIIVINSSRNAPVYDHDGLPISHKLDKKRHGFGLKSIRKIINQYNGDLQMYYDGDSGTFHTIITLKQ